MLNEPCKLSSVGDHTLSGIITAGTMFMGEEAGTPASSALMKPPFHVFLKLWLIPVPPPG